MDCVARGELLRAFFIEPVYYPGFLSICLPKKTHDVLDPTEA